MTEIISGDDSGELRVWNTPRPLSTALRGHSDRMQDVIVSGELLVTSADDGTVRFWDLDSLEPRGRLRSNDGVVKRLYPLGADQLVLSGTEGTSVWSPEPKRRWRIPRAEFQRVVTRSPSMGSWLSPCRRRTAASRYGIRVARTSPCSARSRGESKPALDPGCQASRDRFP